MEPGRPRVRKVTVLFHVILSVALWVTYVAYWRVVLARGVGIEVVVSLGVMVVFALAIYGGTVLWVAHNRRLALRVEGRRTRRPRASGPPPEDFLGRRLEIPSGDAIKRATRVVIHVEGNSKHFRAESPVRAEPELVEESAC